MDAVLTRQLQGLELWRRRKIRHAKQRVRTTVITEERRHAAVRSRLAAQHLSGDGLEIGALHLPLRLPSAASVRYVDRFEVTALRHHYPELNEYDLVAPDIVDDGEKLFTVPDGSVDFVVANHMIEHCEDPISTIRNHLRVLRPGGVMYLAVPDCRFTFDRDRPITPLVHLRRDYLEGPEWSRFGHYEEWTKVFVDAPPAEELERQQYSIHFHVWDPSAFLEFLTACRSEFHLPLGIEALERNDHEFIVILSRAP